MKPRIPILTFHALDNKRSPISVPPDVFRQGMLRLRAAGYHTLTLVQAVEQLRAGSGFPDRRFVITFDDGYRSVHDAGFPTLDECGFTATVFLATGAPAPAGPEDRLPSLEGREMLSWREIRAMHARGQEFGAHTLTHPDLTRLDAARIETELCHSQERVQQMLGAPAPTFAYPFGRYNAESRALAARYFTCAVSDRLGLSTLHSDPFALERVDAYYLRTHRLFDLMPTPWFASYVMLRALPRNLRRALVRKR